MHAFDEWFEPLLARRVPRDHVVPGRVYLIYARNGGIGVAVLEGERLGYRLRREKLGRVFLFVEWDWAEGPPYGTAIPLEEVAAEGPADEADLLTWLEARESAHADSIRAARETILEALGL